MGRVESGSMVRKQSQRPTEEESLSVKFEMLLTGSLTVSDLRQASLAYRGGGGDEGSPSTCDY